MGILDQELTPEQQEIARLENTLRQLQMGTASTQDLLSSTGANAPQGAERAQLEQSLAEMQASMQHTGGLLDDARPPMTPQQSPAPAPMPQLQGGGGGGPLSDGDAFQPTISPDQMMQLYGIMAGGADKPGQVGQNFVKSMQYNDLLRNNEQMSRSQQRGLAQSPSSVREWEYYNSLSDTDKKAYLEMKRGVSLKNIAGSMQGVYSSGLRDPGSVGAGGDVYSTLGQETDARRRESEAQTLGTGNAQRYQVLAESQTGRAQNYGEAKRLRALIGSGDLNPGQYKQLLHTVWNDADMQSLDALAEFAARARLKANGEVRPTDADVLGMKRALFGAGRTEDFTGASLDRLIAEIESQEMEYQRLGRYLQNPVYDMRPPSEVVPPDGESTYDKMSTDELVEAALSGQLPGTQ